MFAGIDWAAEEHAVAVHDDGVKRWRHTVPHSAEGFDRLVAWLARFGDPANLPVATWRPDTPPGRPAVGGQPPGSPGQDRHDQGLA
jgi:hypothetical protein